MRTSQYLLFTLRETPANTEMISYQLMLRAGMIRKLASGLYTWLPTGLRVLKNVENIIRKEMNNTGAIEIFMPIVQPTNLWKESGRLKKYGSELLHFTDRSKHSFILSPTHEEVITCLIRNELNSYKQLPLNLFQIQTKFRDEVRPCFGVIRSREFLMKDAYSFHSSYESLQETYKKMYESYKKIFTNLGLDFYVVQADTGLIGGSISHEFRILDHSNKKNKTELSNIYNCIESVDTNSKTIFLSIPYISTTLCASAKEKINLIDLPINLKYFSDLVDKFNLSTKKTVKIFLVKAAKNSVYPLIALLIRGDHEINKKKVEKLPQVSNPLVFASTEEIQSIVNTSPDFLGLVNIPIIIDHTIVSVSNFSTNTNIDEKYFFGTNWDYNTVAPIIGDISDAVKKDIVLNKNRKKIIYKQDTEIGHIFQLDTKYSQALNASVQGEDGRNQMLIMGCYGIGITRVVAAIIEQNHDKYGITWPDNIAPFQVAIVPINMHRSYRVKKLAEKLYAFLRNQDIDVLIDDRKEHPGVMLADIDLIGIPHIVIIGDRNLHKDNIEYKYRRNDKKRVINIDKVFDFLIKMVKS